MIGTTGVAGSATQARQDFSLRVFPASPQSRPDSVCPDGDFQGDSLDLPLGTRHVSDETLGARVPCRAIARLSQVY